MVEDIRYIIILFILLVAFIIILVKLKQKKPQVIKYDNYIDFLESIKNKDPLYYKKMTTIIDFINNRKIVDIDEIAKNSGCDYYETISKIKVLKRQKAIDNYYIDKENGILTPCTEAEKLLIEKYDQFIYGKQLQPKEIATAFPTTTLDNFESAVNQVLNELSYLDKKDLLNGINIDLVDKRIIYYDIEDFKRNKDYVSIICSSCGAPNDVPRKGKARCEYCDRILESNIKQ